LGTAELPAQELPPRAVCRGTNRRTFALSNQEASDMNTFRSACFFAAAFAVTVGFVATGGTAQAGALVNGHDAGHVANGHDGGHRNIDNGHDAGH
jgi:hypothetical protein